jgi:hypothetical protein
MDEHNIEQAPRRVSARSRRMAVTAAFLGGIAVAGVGVATAQQDSPSTTTAPATKPTAPGGLPERGRGFEKFGGRGALGKFARFGFGGPLGALHGEFVTPNGSGGFRTVDTQTGEVTAVSPTSITVKSEDGFSKKYAVDENTVVNSGRDGIGSVKNGDTVMLSAAVDSGSAKAMRIVDRTTLGKIRDHWTPKRPATGG